MNRTKLDWAEAEGEGHTLVNYLGRKIALFANTFGDVALVIEEDGLQVATTIDVSEALHMVAMLRDAIDVAVPTSQRMAASLGAFDAIQIAKGR